MSSVLFFENPTHLCRDASRAHPAIDLIGAIISKIVANTYMNSQWVWWQIKNGGKEAELPGEGHLRPGN
jgi:hypothetical protein